MLHWPSFIVGMICGVMLWTMLLTIWIMRQK